MNMEPPTAPAMFPAQAAVLTAAKGAPYQQDGTGVAQLGARNLQEAAAANARHGAGQPLCREAALAEPVQNMQQLNAGRLPVCL